ncbi:hypothetical protein D3C79_781830 [compost metagenome]
MADASQFGLHLRRRHHVAVRQVAKIQLHTRLQAPLQRQLIDAERPLAAIGGGRIMPGRIHVRTAVGGDLQPFSCPRLIARQVFLAQAREHRGHFRPALLVVHVVDLWQQRRWVSVRVVVQGYRKVQQATLVHVHAHIPLRVAAMLRRGGRSRALRSRPSTEPSWQKPSLRAWVVRKGG